MMTVYVCAVSAPLKSEVRLQAPVERTVILHACYGHGKQDADLGARRDIIGGPAAVLARPRCLQHQLEHVVVSHDVRWSQFG